MKKKYLFLLPVLFITLFANVNKVKASSVAYYSSFYNYYDLYSSYENDYSTVLDTLTSYYTNNLSSSFSYYVITFGTDSMTLWATNTNQVYSYHGSYDVLSLSSGNGTTSNTCYRYYISTSSYTLDTNCHGPGNNILWYSSNVSLIFKAGPNNNNSSIIQLPSYSNLDYDVAYPQMNLEDGDTLPTYMSLTNGQPSADFTTVDMSQYEYIILSLKNYDTTAFNTTIYSLGSLCLSPVYNYGMTERKDFYAPGSQIQPCTENYSSLTPVPIYILQSDIDNHAVYYIKRYNNETNTLKIPTSIFDITYITSANASDPQVIIGGRSYPVIPYNDLTDTANISTEEGYIPGQVCALGDVNCSYRDAGMDISDLFTHPLELLKSLWSSITNVFLLITAFISLLPPTLQTFLYTAFMLAIILGIIKIIIG